ncbi:hypothetical protein [Halobacterium sp. R2-5]|uniref:hypothetical protein n=1 Tax=Halobacterium sp. R2-5 TaxID=2715751 RepID=UPI0014244B0C|nr:hypothetical protein [Halobacterium sp. R2-5]NIC00569.1 hypothetical protein [Halobacterium sp. R2-5]
MVSSNSETADAEATHGSGGTDRAAGLTASLSERARDGTLAALVGGVLFANALRAARRDRRRAGLFALGGAVLVALGLRQRGLLPTQSGGSGGDEGDTESAEARAHRERADVEHQAEANPRGVSGEPDVETETDPDEGGVQFTTERDVDEAEPKPHLDEEAEDPRLHDEDDPDVDDEHVAVDLSDAGMADEASEATGPTDEQAYPASEGTDPEPMSDKSPQRYGEGEPPDEGSDSSPTDRDDEETETGGETQDDGDDEQETENDRE